jgi:hypothetical protein
MRPSGPWQRAKLLFGTGTWECCIIARTFFLKQGTNSLKWCHFTSQRVYMTYQAYGYIPSLADMGMKEAKYPISRQKNCS